MKIQSKARGMLAKKKVKELKEAKERIQKKAKHTHSLLNWTCPTLVVILALTFWSAVWGIIGAFLSVPLTVCLLIIFSQIKSLRPLAILLSKDGNLDDERRE